MKDKKQFADIVSDFINSGVVSEQEALDMVKEIIEEAMKRDGRIVPLGYHLPVNGGCLFCHHADLPMELKSSSKLRANFHLECLKAKLKAFPDDREVQLLAKEFKNELEDVRAAQLAFIVEEVMLEDRKPVAIFTTSKDEAENWAKQYKKTRSGFPWESFCSIRECYLNPENIDSWNKREGNRNGNWAQKRVIN